MSQIFRAAWRRIVLALLLVPGPAALGHEYKVGDHVVVTKAASLELVDRSVEELLPGMGFAFEVEVDPVAPPGAMFEVDFIKGDRLVVSSGPLVWIDARNVIPLDARAADHFTRLLESDPKNLELHRARAAVQLWQDDAPGAIEGLSEAIQAAPESGELLLMRGSYYQLTGDHESARKDFDAALKLAAPRAEALALRGASQLALGNFAEALDDADEALGYSPGNPYILALRADALAALGVEKVDAAAPAAVADDDQEVGFHYFTLLARGQGFIHLKQYEQAIEAIDAALELSPADPPALALRGAARLALGDREQAYADFRAAWRQEAGCQLIPIYRAQRLIDRNEADEAIAELNEAVRAGLQIAEIYRLRGDAWNLKQEYDKALADFDTALTVDPQSADARFGRSITHYLRGDVDATFAELDEVFAINPDHLGARTNRAVIRGERGDLAGAIADLNVAIRLAPHDATLWVTRGTRRFELGRYDDALADYNEAIRIDPHHQGIYNVRGGILMNLGRFEQAIADFDEDLRSRSDETSLFNRAVCQLILQRPEAVEGFQKTLDVDGWKGRHAAYAVICGHLAARRLGDETAAAKFLTDSTGKLPDPWPLPIVQFLQGEIMKDDLLALAGDVGQQTEVHCYLGLLSRLEHREDQAVEHLRWARDHGPAQFLEQVIAQAELRTTDEPSTTASDGSESQDN